MGGMAGALVRVFCGRCLNEAVWTDEPGEFIYSLCLGRADCSADVQEEEPVRSLPPKGSTERRRGPLPSAPRERGAAIPELRRETVGRTRPA